MRVRTEGPCTRGARRSEVDVTSPVSIAGSPGSPRPKSSAFPGPSRAARRSLPPAGPPRAYAPHLPWTDPFDAANRRQKWPRRGPRRAGRRPPAASARRRARRRRRGPWRRGRRCSRGPRALRPRAPQRQTPRGRGATRRTLAHPQAAPRPSQQRAAIGCKPRSWHSGCGCPQRTRRRRRGREERMRERLHGAGPLLLVEREQTAHQVGGERRGLKRTQMLLHVSLQLPAIEELLEALVFIGGEGEPAGQQNVEDDSQ
mmetsp:Transcript_21938/g.55316  ORF Transcript_21938/g.55316 Transcript_21938/m.55316 type:complete len:258 (-) Transcript_21938:216-989(-)